jgi:hypothetical protein
MTLWEFLASVAWPLVILFIVLTNWESFRSLFDNLAKIAGRASQENFTLAIGNAIKLEFEQRIMRGDIDPKDTEKLARVADEIVEKAVAGIQRKPLKALVNKFNAAPAPFTGLEIPLPNGHKIVIQLRGNEGWISSTRPDFETEEDKDLPSANLSRQGSGYRFDIP